MPCPSGQAAVPYIPKLIKVSKCTDSTAYSSSNSGHSDEDGLDDESLSHSSATHPPKRAPPPLGGYLHFSQIRGKRDNPPRPLPPRVVSTSH